LGIEITVVSDTGPLIHLSEIGCVHLLEIFHTIYVPESVQGEYYKHKRASDPDFFELKNITIARVQHEEVSDFICIQEREIVYIFVKNFVLIPYSQMI
jgi:predicted nucleic acid-binding protein